MAWGTKRRNTILLAVILIIAVPVFVVFFAFYYEAPTCFDGKQNGAEKGVDCGGSCSLLCKNQTLDPLVQWTRFFEVAPGLYNVVAYVENQNAEAGTESMRYKVTLYDDENAILAERFGDIRLRAREIIPIIENVVNTGKIIPARMEFDVVGETIWQSESPRDNLIFVSDEELVEKDGSTRVVAEINNVSLGPVDDVVVAVILYDKNDNAVGASNTFIESIKPNAAEQIVFTWPRLFDGEVVRFEIIPLYESN